MDEINISFFLRAKLILFKGLDSSLSEFEIEIENINGLVNQEEHCSACLRQNLIICKIQDGTITRIEVINSDK